MCWLRPRNQFQEQSLITFQQDAGIAKGAEQIICHKGFLPLEGTKGMNLASCSPLLHYNSRKSF